MSFRFRERNEEMVFNSYIFILLFLPLAIIGYYALNSLRIWKGKAGQFFLLAMSLWFYAYANVRFLPVIAGSIIFNYCIHLLFREKDTGAIRGSKRKLLLAAAVFVNLGVLIYFKYYNFFVDSLNLVFHTSFSIRKLLLPMGISFITFQQIAFVVDSYRGEVKKCSFLEYALFAAFFPHLLSGPIVLHGDFIPLLQDEERKKPDWDRMASGIYLFACGLGKKVLLADMFGSAVDIGYGNIASLNTTTAVFVTLAYTLQIYFDFSGYSDMAVGISRMLNLDLPVNFNSPYKARSISEFWDRWHITLTRFFTRYLYIPLGGSRRGKVRTWINTMIVFLCSGFWHGASWTFIFWGFLHGAAMVLHRIFGKWFSRLPSAFNWLITLLFVNTAWILFRAGSFGVTLDMFRVLFSNRWGALQAEVGDAFLNYLMGNISVIPSWGIAVAYLAVGFGIVLFGRNLYEKTQEECLSVKSGIVVVLLLVLSTLSLSGVSTYVYANF